MRTTPSASRTGRPRRSTSTSPTPCGPSSPTAATRCIRTATTATRCCRAFRSAPTPTTTRRSTATRRAGCCTACSTCPTSRPRCTRSACTSACANRTASQQLQRLCELIETEVPAGEPLVVAGDFNDWRLAAHERLLRCAGLHEVFVAAHGASREDLPGALAAAAARPHLRAQRPRRTAVAAAVAAVVAPVGPRAAGGGDRTVSA